MRKAIGVILVIIGVLGFIGMFMSKAGPVSANNGIAYLLGRLTPIAFLILGIYLLNKKKKEE